MGDFLFVSEQHPQSGRYAVFEEDEHTFWLYLSAAGSERPEFDCLVFNKIPPIAKEDIPSYRGGPVPVISGFASPIAVCSSGISDASFLWSDDGETVALTVGGEPAALVCAGEKSGFTKAVLKDGPWGKCWAEQLFRSLRG